MDAVSEREQSEAMADIFFIQTEIGLFFFKSCFCGFFTVGYVYAFYGIEFSQRHARYMKQSRLEIVQAADYVAVYQPGFLLV